jgi:hypothetical protein
MATEQQQEHPPTEQVPPPPKKAAARENLAFLTSGAKEKVDKTIAGMKGAGHIMSHGFSKQAKEEANAQTAEEKAAIGDKQERIRQTAHMQLVQEKAAADGFEPLAQGGAQGGPQSGSQLAQDQYQDTQDLTAGKRDLVNQTEAAPAGMGGNLQQGNTLGEMLHSEDKTADSSDSSSRARAQALNQIPPDSQEYRSA